MKYSPEIQFEGSTPLQGPKPTLIAENLYLGAQPVGSTDKEISFIVNLYPWGAYNYHDHQTVLAVPLLDSPVVPPPPLLFAITNYINDVRNIGKVLVHCQQGLNRSPLIAALVLMTSGMTPKEAIQHIRKHHDERALFNKVFEGWLLAQKGFQKGIIHH